MFLFYYFALGVCLCRSFICSEMDPGYDTQK